MARLRANSRLVCTCGLRGLQDRSLTLSNLPASHDELQIRRPRARVVTEGALDWAANSLCRCLGIFCITESSPRCHPMSPPASRLQIATGTAGGQARGWVLGGYKQTAATGRTRALQEEGVLSDGSGPVLRIQGHSERPCHAGRRRQMHGKSRRDGRSLPTGLRSRRALTGFRSSFRKVAGMR